MTNENLHTRNEVKEVKFHHKVKRFYYKNLFRKIYTVAIIGLIGANVFSIMKYASYADELENLNTGLLHDNIHYTDVAGNDKYIMSYNLGATEYRDIDDIDYYSDNPDGALGLFYQWGNDNGFTRENVSLCGTPPSSLDISNVENDSDLEIMNNSLDFCNYDNSGYPWQENKQGPCPAGYHVPTMSEWTNLFVQWCEDNEEVCDTRDLQNAKDWGYEGGENYWYQDGGDNIQSLVEKFMADYNLPLAGYRRAYSVNGVGDGGYYWSSTSIDSFNARGFSLSPSYGAGANYGDGRDLGQSVRCIEGSYSADEDPLPLALDLYLGDEDASSDENKTLESIEIAEVASASSLDIDEKGLISRIFIPAGQHIPNSKLAKLDIGFDWYTENEKNPDYLVDLDEWSDGISLQFYNNYRDPESGTLKLYGFSKCGDNRERDSATHSCVISCMGDGAVYDESTDQCIYTARDVMGNEIKIMDHNLGATRLTPNGKYYQWGNNEGYSYGSLSSSEYNRFEAYSYDDNKWTTGAQGPCPEGYHVPTADEWNNIFVQWCEDDNMCDTRDMWYDKYGKADGWNLTMQFVIDDNYQASLGTQSLGNGMGLNNLPINTIVNKFMHTYNLPLAGSRNANDVYDVGTRGGYWSSTPIGNGDARDFDLDPSHLAGARDFSRDLGLSVRCVESSYSGDEAPRPFALDLYLGDEDMPLDSLNISSLSEEDYLGRIFVAEGLPLTAEKKSKLAGYDWYTENEKSEEYRVDIDTVVFRYNPTVQSLSEVYGESNSMKIPLFGFPKDDGSHAAASCLGAGSTYDEESRQCVYTATDINGREIKIMDANLGATRANPMGDFFQWGRDRAWHRNGSLEGSNNDTGTEYYDFNDYWQKDENGDYVRDENGNDIPKAEYNWEQGAQGLCPAGYHIPTIDEWQNIFISRCEKNPNCDIKEFESYDTLDYYTEQEECLKNNPDNCDYSDFEQLERDKNLVIENGMEYKWVIGDGRNGKYADMISSFMADYNLPLAGSRDANGVNGVGDRGGYWSSTSIDSFNARGFSLSPSYGAGANYGDGRDLGQSVRCVESSYPAEEAPLPLALDLFVGGDDVDDDLYIENQDRVGRKFVGSGDTIDVNRLTAVADLPSPDEGKEWTWYLVNEQDEAARLTSQTRLTDNSKVYAFQENKSDAPDPVQPDSPTVQPSTPSTPSYSGGGGRKATKVTDTKSDTSSHNSAETPQSQATAPLKSGAQDESDGSSLSREDTALAEKSSLDMSQYNATYTPEQNTAYQFAKSHGITTTSSIKEAKMNTPLTRIQMAKMLSQYAMNVLGKTPDHSAGVENFRDVTNKLNSEYDNAVTLAYQLGIMGINMPNREFRPYDKVTRAEFATALSRMLYDMDEGKYTSTSQYYVPHMARLYNEGIINVTNPTMQELRGNVMTMLMRTVK